MAASPIDELRRCADEVWDKIAPGYVLTDADIAAIVRAERAMRQEWIDGDKKKKVAREEKKAQKDDEEV